MEVIKTPLEGLLLLKPTVYEDNRGYFFESYNEKMLSEVGIRTKFVQDNQSLSEKNVIRGLHFQAPPYAQAKLVRVITGAVLDVVVDIRKSSATYGKTYSVELTEKNKWMLYIPEGFAHGFETLENKTIFFYKCSQFYNKAAERAIYWNDLTLNLPWRNPKNPILSAKDKEGIPFTDFVSPFD